MDIMPIHSPNMENIKKTPKGVGWGGTVSILFFISIATTEKVKNWKMMIKERQDEFNKTNPKAKIERKNIFSFPCLSGILRCISRVQLFVEF